MSEVFIAPSILAADFATLGDDIKEIEKECRFLHLDIMDGHFVPNLSFGIPVVETLRKHTGLIFDTHLMVDEPKMFIKPFIDAGSDYVTFHIECTDEPFELIKEIRSYGRKAGVAIHPYTPIEKIYPFTKKDAVDLILVMSVVPGFGGQSFMAAAKGRLIEVRNRLDKNGSEALLSVDGGIKDTTIKDAVSSGARLIVSGSSVFGKPDKAGAIRNLLDLSAQALNE